MDTTDDDLFMRAAIEEARKALVRGDRPIGAVIVHRGRIVSRASSTFPSSKSNIAHAELNALLQAAPYLQEHGRECAIYTTCEPCPMCLGAIVMANIREIVYGMPDNHTCARLAINAVPYLKRRVHRYVGGILRDDCIALYRTYSREEVDLCLNGRPEAT